MHKLNHESIVYTKRYLGITDDELEAVAQRLNRYCIFSSGKMKKDLVIL